MVWFTNNTALILTPEADQCRSKISLLAASDTFTQRRVRRIGAGSPHANSSVNRATLTTNRLQSQRHDPASLCLHVDSVLCPLSSAVCLCWTFTQHSDKDEVMHSNGPRSLGYIRGPNNSCIIWGGWGSLACHLRSSAPLQLRCFLGFLK